MPDVLTLRQLNRATLARQLLLERSALDALGAIECVGPLQAQEAQPPHIALWTRLKGFKASHLTSLLHGKSAVRMTAMRATLHLLSAADYGFTRAALEAPLRAVATSMLRKRMEGIDVEAVTGAAREFFGRGPAPFEAFREHLATLFPGGDVRAMAYMARLHLPLVQTPDDSLWGFPAEPAFTLASNWSAGLVVGDSGSVARHLMRRYLSAFGPASAADAKTWLGIKEAAQVLRELTPELVEFRDEKGRVLYDVPDGPRPLADTPAPVRLLPEFDSLMLAHDDRTRVIADEHRPMLVTKNLRVKAVVLVDGFAAGFWTWTRSRKSAVLQVEPFGRLSKKVLPELEAEAKALLRFVEPDADRLEVRITR